MRGIRIPFLLLVYSHLVVHIIAKSQISCLTQDPPRQRLADSKKPISLKFEHPGRNRTYLIPAAFRSGTCVILVSTLGSYPHPPANAASLMYFKVWPNVRKAAGKIVQKCSQQTPRWSWFGWVLAWSWVNQWQFHYIVEVRWAPEVATRNGEKRRMDASEVLYTIYQTD